MKAEFVNVDPDVSAEFEEQVEYAAQRILDLLNLSEDRETTEAELLCDMHPLESDSGKYRVTSKGRGMWEGTTLMGALTALVVRDYERPVRIWRVYPNGRRRLVLIDTYCYVRSKPY